MSNNWFEFKQFKVHQQLAAMKVGTDGVLLGAWAPADNAQSILDIGCGTGLIALMMAQRNLVAQIDSVEIESQAYQQACFNYENSKWNSRLNCVNQSIQDYANTTSSKYDLIVCNPPFFQNSLKSPLEMRTFARHTNVLPFDELADSIHKLLNEKGVFSFILPTLNAQNLQKELSRYGLTVFNSCGVKPTLSKEPHRSLCSVSKEAHEPIYSELTIETETRHRYTNEYKQLTRDFYLAF